MTTHPTDEELLTSVDPQAFGVFYARHLDGVERYFARRVANREPAADLAAETFAAALVARRRFMPGATPAAGWLYTIAARRLVDYQRRAMVEQRARESLESEARVDARWASPSVDDGGEPALLRSLPGDQRSAVAAYVLAAQSYEEIASVPAPRRPRSASASPAACAPCAPRCSSTAPRRSSRARTTRTASPAGTNVPRRSGPARAARLLRRREPAAQARGSARSDTAWTSGAWPSSGASSARAAT